MCLDSGKKYKPSNNIARRGRCFLMTKTFPELPNQAHTFPLSSDIGLQVFLVGIHSPNTGINHFADFLEAQGISVEKTTTPTKVQVPTRRIASLPPHFLTDPQSSPSPHKKPRLMSSQSQSVRAFNENIYAWSNFYVPGFSPSFFRTTEDSELFSQAGRRRTILFASQLATITLHNPASTDVFFFFVVSFSCRMLSHQFSSLHSSSST